MIIKWDNAFFALGTQVDNHGTSREIQRREEKWKSPIILPPQGWITVRILAYALPLSRYAQRSRCLRNVAQRYSYIICFFSHVLYNKTSCKLSDEFYLTLSPPRLSDVLFPFIIINDAAMDVFTRNNLCVPVVVWVCVCASFFLGGGIVALRTDLGSSPDSMTH